MSKETIRDFTTQQIIEYIGDKGDREDADFLLKGICQSRLKELYGDEPPALVQERFDQELQMILEKGYEVIYLMAMLLAQKSEQDGYLVNSRGCAAGSFAAYLMGITNINPLIPHYLCPECKHTILLMEYDNDPGIVGPDLPEQQCPHCGQKMHKDGFNILWEPLFGLNGEKEPDINLNYCIEEREAIRKYVLELLGEKKVFVSAANKYITYILIPKGTDFGDRTPLRFEIFGHTTLSMLHTLQDLTGVDPAEIEISDPKVLSLFSSCEALGVEPEQLDGFELGTLGLPLFGSDYATQIIQKTKPKNIADLIRIPALAQGTEVWLRNGESLISGGADFKDIICCRDDIMQYLQRCGMERWMAYDIMERVRKGRGLSSEIEAEMRKYSVPDWYIESCNKIMYLFPRAHEASYTDRALRVAYYKVYHPQAFYKAYFNYYEDENLDVAREMNARGILFDDLTSH